VVAGRSEHDTQEGDLRRQGLDNKVAGVGAAGAKNGVKGEICC
jgi:hypothetical protein